MSTRFIFPSNFSYDDPLPFECENDKNVELSLIMYAIQAIYLILGIVLNVFIIQAIFRSKKSVYRNNSFYILYTADAIVTIYKCIIEVSITRVIIFITPLCSIISPYFFTPSILTKTYFLLVHYSSSFRTISQIFMSFNRMTCVIFPITHDRIWKKILYPVLILIFIIPLDTTWIIMIARVYLNPNGAGFSVNYKETNGWPKLSLIHLIECIIGFGLVIICFIATIIGLTTLENRLKNAEKSLTFVTMIMAIQTLFFAFIQMYFAFLATSTPNLRQFFLAIVPFVSDSINVFSPIALILMNQQLKSDIFKTKNGNQQRTSRSVSMTHQQTLFHINSRFFFAFILTVFSESMMFGIAQLSCDFLTVRSPIIMLSVSRSLREHILKFRIKTIGTRPPPRAFTLVISNSS